MPIPIAEQTEDERVDEAAHQGGKGRYQDLAVEEGIEQSHGVS